MSFILLYWKQGLIILAVLGLVAFGIYFQGLRIDKARLEIEVKNSKAIISQLSFDLNASQQALKNRAIEIASLAKEKDKALTDLENIYKNDPIACDWKDVKIPESIFNSLFE
jgi:hypothetical protein